MKRERIIWISLVFAVFVFSVLIIHNYQKSLVSANQTITNLEKEQATWAEKEKNLALEISGLKAQLEIDEAIIKTFHTSDSGLVKKIERQGLDGGPNEVIEDLLKHRELIPYEGILGGTMAFWKNESFVISDRWVIAYFEDGHNGGRMLLQYNVNDGIISWKVIDSYLNGE